MNGRRFATAYANSNQHGGANFVPFNTADNWLHFVLGVGMIGLGFATARSRNAVPAT